MYDYDDRVPELDISALYPEEIKHLQENNFIKFYQSFLRHRSKDMIQTGYDADTIRAAALIIHELYKNKFS